MGLHTPKARRLVLLFSAVLLHSSLAFGSPSNYSSDYILQVWQTDQGLPENSVTAMVQTSDGYLWFGTFNGLVRFDGIKFTVFDRSNTPDLPSPGIVNLYLDRSDRLWVSTLLGTAYVKDGRWRVFQQQDGWTGDYVWRFAETSSGDIYLTTFDHKILRFDGDCFHEIVRPPVANPELGFQPYVDGTNDFWVINPQFIGKFARGKWQELIPAPSPMIEKYRFLRPNLNAGGSRDGGLWIVTTHYLRKYHSKRLMFETRAPWTLENLWNLYEDSSGGVWITSWRDGLYHFSAEQGWQHFTTDNGLPYDAVRFVFEDREHNLWVGTNGGGLARFKHRYLTNWGLEQGMPDRVIKSLTVDGKGRMYFGTWGQGVGQLAGFRITRILEPHEKLQSPDDSCRNLFDGLVVSTLVDHKGRFWVSTYASGLFLFENHTCHGFFVSANSNSPQLAPIFEDHHGTIWVGTQDGVFAFDGTQFRKYFFSPRPEHSNASGLAEDGARKILWVANRAGGLYRFDGQNLVPVPGAGVLANDRISTLFTDPDSTLWIGTEDAGIACVRKGVVTRISEQQGLPAHSIASILGDEVGNLWFGSNRGILRAGRKELEELISGHKNRIEFQVFNQSDGMGVAECSLGTQPTVVKDPRGRLWFATFKGAVMVDPKSLRLNTQPPPLVIEQVLVDDQPVAGRPAFATSAAEFPLRVTVPPGDHRLEIHYAALSFTAPEKVRFRTMLEGFDKEWIEVGDRRAAYVQHMKPGKYRFRLKAANNDGIWNETGTIAELYFRPHFYETYWFYASCLLGAVAVGASLHRWRVRELAQQFNMRLEGRVAERTRIARDLHDTLLQSFQGLMLHFQTGIDLLPGRPAQARKTLEIAIDRADQAIAEGRDAVQGLRASTVETNDLASAVRVLGEELRAEGTNQNSALFEMEVEGTPRNLHPILRDEVYRITGEALRNAFRHARAQRIEVEILYGERWLRLRVRDDGKGIDSKLLSGDGLVGHYGLHGMRERAKLVGGKLAVWSKLDSGAEVELSIPASTAYAKPARHRSWLFEKLSGKGTDFKETDVKETKARS
jgi:ligand-binding sensor domain-containing protein/signal transduction histidine kinase